MRWLPALVLLAVVMSWIPAAAQVDDEEVRRARAELERLQSESRDLSAEYQAVWAEDAELQDRIERLQTSIASLGLDLRQRRDQVRELAVELYMNNAVADDLVSLLLSATPTDLASRSEYLHDIRNRDQAMVNGLELLTRQLEEETEELAARKEEQETALARLEEIAIELNERLAEGQEYYALLQQQQEEERARLEAEEQARLEAERIRAEEEARAATSTTAAPATTTTTPDYHHFWAYYHGLGRPPQPPQHQPPPQPR